MARESYCFCILQPWLLATTKKPIDSRITSHAAHAAYKKILIRTDDTDVVVVAVALARTPKEEIEVWVSISTGKSFRVWAGHEIARALGFRVAYLSLISINILTNISSISLRYNVITIWHVLI